MLEQAVNYTAGWRRTTVLALAWLAAARSYGDLYSRVRALEMVSRLGLYTINKYPDKPHMYYVLALMFMDIKRPKHAYEFVYRAHKLAPYHVDFRELKKILATQLYGSPEVSSATTDNSATDN